MYILITLYCLKNINHIILFLFYIDIYLKIYFRQHFPNDRMIPPSLMSHATHSLFKNINTIRLKTGQSPQEFFGKLLRILDTMVTPESVM